jgi:hypothetical protein
MTRDQLDKSRLRDDTRRGPLERQILEPLFPDIETIPMEDIP